MDETTVLDEIQAEKTAQAEKKDEAASIRSLPAAEKEKAAGKRGLR